MTFTTPSVIETERLRLRIPCQRDWSDLHQYYSDPECTRYTNGKPMSETESWRKLAALVGHWHLQRYGSYALEEKSTGNVIGVAGLEFPQGWPDTEIQWGLARNFWRKGYASEAVKAIRSMVAQHLPAMRPISIIHPHNLNSILLAASLGAKLEKAFLFRDETWHVYRHSILIAPE